MYRAFNLVLPSNPFSDIDFLYSIGKEIYQNQKKAIKRTLEDLSETDGSLSAEKMRDAWFPSVNAELFISHSHKDEKSAIALVGWLRHNFGITGFVDSSAWGYSDELLRAIDKKYCYDDTGKMYDYQKRNQSTSHVHMLLATSLMQMIDKTECLFFLNTPNSISANQLIENSSGRTRSPWIYYEIALTKYLRAKTKNSHRKVMNEAIRKSLSKGEDLQVNYHLDDQHLTKLFDEDMVEWQNSWKSKSKSDPHGALDLFYELQTT